MRTAFPAAAAAVVVCLLPPGPSLEGSTAPWTLLRQIARFTEAEWRAVERGEAVARVLDTDTRQVAVVGAVRIRGPRERLIERYRDVESLKNSSLVLDVGRFSRLPQPADLAAAPLEPYSLDLRGCRPGDCRVRLGAADIERFQREVPWHHGGWRERSAAIWRDVLARYARAYWTVGRRALPEFVNKPEPLSVASELSLLLQEYGFVAAYSPEFHRYMQEFGPAAPPGSEHALYWTKEDFGVRPVIRINHQVVYRTAGASPVALIATNQVYADHYLDAALNLALAIDAGGGGRDFYLIAVSRARTRSLSGLLRRFVRATVQGRSRAGLEKILTSTKRALERDVPRTVPGPAR